jgi:hypothetical protein
VRLSSAANLNNGNDPIVIDIEQLTPEQLKAIKERGVESVEISDEANEGSEYDIVLHLGGTEPARPARRRPLHGADTLGQFYQVQAQQDNIDGLLSDAELNAIYEAQFQGAVTGAMFLLPVDEATVGVYILGKTVNGLVRLGSSAARFVRGRSAARGTGIALNSSGGVLTRTFNLNGKQVPLIGGGDPVVGRTLKNGLTEIKTSITGSVNDAANLFRHLVGDSAKPLANGKGFRSVLDDGREVVFRPTSSGRSGGIPKIEIRDPNFGISEKINFTR